MLVRKSQQKSGDPEVALAKADHVLRQDPEDALAKADHVLREDPDALAKADHAFSQRVDYC